MTLCPSSPAGRSAALAVLLWASAALAQPANDSCYYALPYTSGTTVSGTTVGGTTDGSSTCGASYYAPDVWYRMTAGCSGPLRLSLCGSDVNFDTVLSIYTGSPYPTPGSLHEVACNDDSGPNSDCPFNLRSSIDFNTVAWTTYYIRVSGYSGSSGTFVLSSRYLTVGSDSCAAALPVADGSYPFCNCGATTDGPQECDYAGDNQINKDLWFSYTATHCGLAAATTCGSPAPNTLDTKIAVYSNGCPQASGTAIACNDDAFCAPYEYLSSVTFPITTGRTYLIRVGGYNESVGTATLFIASRPGCGSADFDCDGDLGTDADIQAFFACLGGQCPPSPCCASADFNGDGDVGTDTDIEAFFRVLGGGNC
jgi:hypothetical protein